MRRFRFGRIFKFLAGKGGAQAEAVRVPIVWWAVGFVSALLVLFVVILWMASAVYSELPPQAKLDETYKPADVVVCLTGGKGRIRKALELYEKGYGRMLYISGTDRQVQMREILRELRWVGPVDDSRIVLENIATNTIQNALQVRHFLTEQGLKRILLVTSVYHVRRAYYIFRKVLPGDVQIDVTWFEHEPFEESDWWAHSNGIWVTITEFFKFFYAYVRLAS